MFPGPFFLTELLTKVRGPHKQVYLRQYASALAFGRSGAAFSAVEWLAFACRRYPTLWIDGIRVGSGHSVRFWIWRQLAGPLV